MAFEYKKMLFANTQVKPPTLVMKRLMKRLT